MEVLQHIDAGEVKHLLELLQPQERVETRTPKEQQRPKLPNDPDQPKRPKLSDAHDKFLREMVQRFGEVPPPPRPGPAPFRGPKRRRGVTRNYEVVDYGADRRHRRGTWTAVMVAGALANGNTRDAEQWVRENYPEFADRSIDWTWLADKQNYIRFN